jgi:diguanylate cyclase (GGDEF)-like protein
MNEDRKLTASGSALADGQENRIRVAQSITLFVAFQSAIVNLFAASGVALPWVARAFMVLSIGTSLLFWGVYKSGLSLRWRRVDLALPQSVLLVSIQFGFVLLAPKLAVIFLLVALVIFTCALVQLSYSQFAIGCFVYAAASGMVLYLVRDRFGYPGNSDLQLTLLWLFFTSILASFVFVRTQNNRLRGQLAQAIEQLSVSAAKLEALARHDSLTGVFNRQAMIEILEAELLRAHRTGHPFCFAVIDLDHFGMLNEKYGSGVGDLVLKGVAEASMKLLRALDRFGRIGGEEFGILLPATWLDQGMIAMGRLAKAVEGYDWEKITPGMNVTFSGGITTNAINDTAEVIIKRADEALLQAKREGRHRIVQAEEALPDMPPLDLD